MFDKSIVHQSEKVQVESLTPKHFLLHTKRLKSFNDSSFALTKGLVAEMPLQVCELSLGHGSKDHCGTTWGK